MRMLLITFNLASTQAFDWHDMQ